VVLTSDDEYYYLSVLNRDTARYADMRFIDSGKADRLVEAKIVNTDNFFAYSTFDDPYVLNIEEKATDISDLRVPPHSYAIFKIPLPDTSSENVDEIFEVYPNPATETIILTNKIGNKADIRIYDSMGRQVQSVKGMFQDRSINISGLSAGVYIIHDQDSGYRYKFVKR
jgi:hypothetical protein